jgi:PAS domain S-box-containing protein
MTGSRYGDGPSESPADSGSRPARIYVLVADDSNRRLLVDWLDEQEDYEPVTGPDLAEASFDLCLLDRAALESNFAALRECKEGEPSALLPYLYLLPTDASAFETGSRLRETLVQSTVDEVLSQPVSKAELGWRLDSLLQMRDRTIALAERDRTVQRFGRAIESTDQAIYVTDTDGTITYVNPGFEELTGYTAAQAIGETPRILHSGEMAEEYYADLWATIEAGETWVEEIVNERADGERYTAIQTIAPVPDADGGIDSYVAIQTDVTELKSLRTRQRRYRQAIESAIDLLAAVDTDGEFLFANAAYREYHGLNDRDVRGQTLESVLDGDVYAEVRPRLERALDGETVHFEMTRSLPEQGSRVLDILYYPLRDDAGAIRGAIASMRDVTEAKERSRRLEALIGNLPGIVYRCRDEPGWPMEFVGGRCAGITGYSPVDLESDDVSWGADVVHPEDRERVAEAVRAAIEAGDTFEVTYRIRTASGETRWVREQGQQVRPLTADEPMLEGFIMDVTERRERKAELEQKSRAMDEAPIGISISDPAREDNPLVYVNDGFVDLTGYTHEEAIGRNCRFLQGEHTDPDAVAAVRRAIDAAEEVSVVLRNYRADGTEFWNRLEIAPVRNADGEVINYIGFQQDVTARVERQEQLQKIDRTLRHTLRNDMNVVLANAEQIQAEGSPPVTEAAESILETSESLLEKMDREREIVQLLGEKPDVRPIELMSLVRPVVESLRESYPEATIGLTGPEEVRVRGTARLEQAVEELLRNAIEHSDRDRPGIDLSVSAGPETVSLAVADDGPGIPGMEVEILTGGAEETPVYHGQGLGLWEVHLIVRRCGGTVTFDGGDSRGSVVTVTLDAA